MFLRHATPSGWGIPEITGPQPPTFRACYFGNAPALEHCTKLVHFILHTPMGDHYHSILQDFPRVRVSIFFSSFFFKFVIEPKLQLWVTRGGQNWDFIQEGAKSGLSSITITRCIKTLVLIHNNSSILLYFELPNKETLRFLSQIISELLNTNEF